jgi:phosphomevalonate kinase
MKLRASAPGKVVLLGEYAVLYGAPALVMAADRRAIVGIEDSDRPGIEILAPDVHPQPVHLTLADDGTPHWTQGFEAASAFTLVTGLLRGLVLIGALKPEALACRLQLDTSAFFWHNAGTVDKLGLGSSAALTVALASALVRYAGRSELLADRAAWLRQLLALHRDFQGGRGSGLDVAASLYGGVIRYQLRAGDQPHAERLRWPPELQTLMVWSGRSASTSRFLADLEAWRAAQPPVAADLFNRMTTVAASAAIAAGAGNCGQVMEFAQEYSDLLQRLGEAAKIAIFTTEHTAIRAVVEADGMAESATDCGSAEGFAADVRMVTRTGTRPAVIYKPCGAGGGDLGMAMAIGRDAAVAARSRLASAGWSVVALNEDPIGLQIELVE